MNSISSGPISQSNLLLTMANKISSSLYPNSDLLVSFLPNKLSCCTALTYHFFIFIWIDLCVFQGLDLCRREFFKYAYE